MSAGKYQGLGNRALTFRGAPKSLLALADAWATIVDAQLADRAFVFNSGETYFSYVSGMAADLSWGLLCAFQHGSYHSSSRLLVPPFSGVFGCLANNVLLAYLSTWSSGLIYDNTPNAFGPAVRDFAYVRCARY